MGIPAVRCELPTPWGIRGRFAGLHSVGPVLKRGSHRIFPPYDLWKEYIEALWFSMSDHYVCRRPRTIAQRTGYNI
jgi:hypothetical protein